MIFEYRENKTHNLRIQLFDWNEGSSCIEIPELFPLFLLHALARRPGQGDLLPVQSELVEVLQSPDETNRIIVRTEICLVRSTNLLASIRLFIHTNAQPRGVIRSMETI